MNDSSITIVTGAIQSGKTTYLLSTYQNKKNVYGIVTPVVDGKRMFMDIATNEVFPMEASENDKEILAVGKYKFCKHAFDKAVAIMQAALKQKKGIIILDEAGPLELKGSGFDVVLRALIADKNKNLKKIVVVREQLFDDVVNAFQLTAYHTIHP